MVDKKQTVKPIERNLDLLAYLLGKGWLKHSWFRLLSAKEFQKLHGRMEVVWGERASKIHILFVLSNIAANELAIKNLDLAMASEIVFSPGLAGEMLIALIAPLFLMFLCSF